MSHWFPTDSPLRIFGFAIVISLLTLTMVGAVSGLEALFSVLVLAVIEMTFSFENAVVNAKVLSKMPRIWQFIFLTLGIAIAVFGMRMVLPLALVAVTADLSMSAALDLALHHADEYANRLSDAHAVIAAFGGSFLLMIFLHFLFEDRDVHWLERLERPARQLNAGWAGPTLLSIVALAVVAISFGGPDLQRVIIAGSLGIVTYLAIKLLSEKFQKQGEAKMASLGQDKKPSVSHLVQAGLFSFIYLELLDASFSFDGVVAAFAITDNVLLIAAGLGVGAVFVRSMTVFLLRRGTLNRYIYLEHGAYYAVGMLAFLMLIGIGQEIPSFVTGILGVGIIGLSVASSRRIPAKRRG